MIATLHSLRALRWEERTALGQALLLLPLIAIGLRLFGYQRVHSAMARVPSRRPPHGGALEVAEAVRLARLVDIAARRGAVRTTCLATSLCLWMVLRRRGMPTELRIGARRASHGLHFHAWLMHEGEVLNDRPMVVSAFAPFDDRIVPRRARFD